MSKKLLFRLVVLMTAMMCALGAAAAEAYACYTSDNTTLTFYYDDDRSSRTGKTYDLNTGSNKPGWYSDGTYAKVTKVVFDPSFADARPTSTQDWFAAMRNLTSITGMKEYLNTSEVTDMGYMFVNCEALTSLDVSGFNTSKVTSMCNMFDCCIGLTSLDVSSFNTANVTDMTCMFDCCIGLTSLDLSSFNTSKVEYMTRMFYGCNSLRTIYVGNGWSTAAATYSSHMFWNCISLVGGQGTTYDANHIDKAYAHIDGGTFNQGPGYFTYKGPEAYACYTSSNTTLTFYYDDQRSFRSGTTYDLNTRAIPPDWRNDGTNDSVTNVVFDPSFAGARPTYTLQWFYEMTNLQSITGMSYLNTSEVTDMAWMFSECNKLTSLDLSSFNTSNVMYMTEMFSFCTSLTNLDLSSFNTSQVTNMDAMFYNCNSLHTIYAGSGWNTAGVTSSVYMFLFCNRLVGGKGTAYDASNPRDKTYAHIDGGPDDPGYFSDKNASLRGDADGDGSVDIADVTTLIDILLSGETALQTADCDQDGSINIGDLTALSDYLLNGTWP